jgi:RNA polymerase sigma-70 factor (ECF subfamily)
MQAVNWQNGLEQGARPAGLLLKAGKLQDKPLHDRPTQTDPRLKSPAELARLVEAVAARQDRDAFVTLFDHFAPRIKAFLMRSNLPAAAAEELVQDALLTVWRKASQFDRERAGASSWIFAIARNLRIDSARREMRGKVLDLEATDDAEPPAPPDAELLASEREQRVRAALDHLTDEQRRVVRLSFFDGKAHGDIAAELELPLGTVKSRIRLAMNRLREALGDLT